jgi:hypothetical protein
MELGPVQADLKKGAELGGRTNVFQELQGLAYPLFRIQMTLANAKVSTRTKDHCIRCFRTVAHLGKASCDHFLLDVVKLLLGHVAAGGDSKCSLEATYPVSGACFVSTQRSFAHVKFWI